tara:strand:+ start:3516 stop:7169 length:3654 start_codon:yes stop_codon:yes gene_type:complete
MVKRIKWGSTKEGFRSRRQTMDTVLDAWCSNKYSDGTQFKYNDYVNKNNWRKPLYTGEATPPDCSAQSNCPVCSTYDCPIETCKTLTSNTVFGRTEYYYQTIVSNQEKKDDGNCISKHNSESNVYCEPHGQPPHCDKLMTNNTCFRFDSSRKEWTEIEFNNYLSSNGSDCVYQQSQYPYKPIYYSNQEYQLGSSDAQVKCFDKADTTSCQITYDDWNNIYTNSLGHTVAQPDYTSEFVHSRNSFVCDNGNKLNYGYSNNTSGKVDGMTCGFLNDNCSSCPISKETCYVFDCNIREYNENVFMNVYWEHGGEPSDYCDKYRVIQSRDEVDNFESVDWNEWSKNIETANQIYNGMFLRNQNNKTSYTTHSNFLDSNTCSNAIPYDCSSDETTLLTKIKNITNITNDDIMNSLISKIRRNELNLVDVNDNDVPVLNQFHDLTYNRQWNSNGTACEFCLIDTFSGSRDNIGCVSNMPVSQSAVCETGQQLVQTEFRTYCRYCSINEYYNETTSNCEPLSGCGAGKRFAPFMSNNNIFPYGGQELTETSFDVSSNYFTSDTDNQQCSSCESNTYIDDTEHTNRSCKSCPISRGRYTEEVYTVNATNSECSICGGSVKKNKENSKGYIVVNKSDSNSTPTCSNCQNLGETDDDVQAGVAKIVGLTEFDLNDTRQGDGRCIKKCGGLSITNIGNKQILPNRDIEYSFTDSNFSNCPFACPSGYSQGSDSCSLCQEGTQLDGNNNCISCENGFYNNRSGGVCIACPTTMQALKHQPITTQYTAANDTPSNTGASNIAHCRVECLDQDDDGSNVYAYYTTANSVDDYDFDSCPSTPCVAGFTKSNLIDDDDGSIRGYSLSNAMGTQNKSMGETSQFSCTYLGTGVLEQSDSCVIESSGRTYKEERYTQGTTCCKANLKNNGYRQCDCPDNGNLNDPLANSNMVWDGDYCVKQCKEYEANDGNDGSNGRIVLLSNKCELECNSGTYPKKTNDESLAPDTCGTCPLGLNMSEPRFETGGTGIESCYTRTCSEGYNKAYAGYSYWSSSTTPGDGEYLPKCVEIQMECPTLEVVGFGSFYHPDYVLKQDDVNEITVKELGTSTTPVGECPGVAYLGTRLGDYDVTCPADQELNFSPTPVIDLTTGNPMRRTDDSLVTDDSTLFCCPPDHHKIGVYNDVFLSGCCRPNQTLNSEGTCVTKCDPKENQNYTMEPVSGKCLYYCDAGYVDEDS